MAKIILTDAYLSVNGVNLSAWVDTIEVTANVDDVDLTTMGAVSHQHGRGLRDDQIQVTFINDDAVSAVNSTLWPLFIAGTEFTVFCKNTSAASSTTNPSYYMHSQMMSFTPISGSVGDRSENDVTFMPSSISAGIVRYTT